MTQATLIQLAYIAASILFIFGLKMLSSPKTARRGNRVSALGMLIAVIATLMTQGLEFQWIILGILIGGTVGVTAALRVPMTSMPEFVALFNGFGGIASLLVGWAEYQRNIEAWSEAGAPLMTVVAIYLAMLIGGVTFTGSLIAYGKLSETISGKPVLFSGQQVVNGLIVAGVVLCGVLFVLNAGGPEIPMAYTPFLIAIALAFTLGVLATIPIGGGDMPVVISLLNSYSGLAACAAGFVIQNTVLIVSGSLVGASGMILTMIMCKAMNRSLGNVLFSGFGSATTSGGTAKQGEAKPISAEDTFLILENARSVIFVPGYGMAVAQAQHAVRELAELLEANGAEVKFVVHPVAGRMPGHMNVLLAEANVPYEKLVEIEDVNPIIETVDAAIVIGANDVVNPDAREDPASSIYGMPIVNVDLARTCIVCKRSLASGFAGIENPLFFKENTRMFFGDAKSSMQALVSEFKE